MSPKAILPDASVPRQIEKESTTPALRSALGTEIIPLPKPRTPSGAISCKNPPVCVCPHLQQFSEYRKDDLQISNPPHIKTVKTSALETLELSGTS
jgi:hypothetical protein